MAERFNCSRPLHSNSLIFPTWTALELLVEELNKLTMMVFGQALQLIRPTNCLKYHPVSSAVNDSRNHAPECVQEIDLKLVRKCFDL